MFRRYTMSKFICFVILAVTLISSCKVKREMVYFQENEKNSDTLMSEYTPKIEPDDLLGIVVTSENPEQALQFNFPVLGNSSTTKGGYTTGTPVTNAYLVDQDGMINFPVLGEIEVGGLTRSEVITILEDKIAAYISKPVVQVSIQNFKITVIGDVSSPGTFTIPNERITVIEALALSGDLKITGVRRNILVIRELNGVRKEYRLDLTSKEVFSSPAYYLKQNDVVYVEPNMAARSQGTFFRTTGSIFISIAAVIVATINAFI